MVMPAAPLPPWVRSHLARQNRPAERPSVSEEDSLMVRTRQLLRDSGKSLPVIHAELHAQGSDITFYWLRKFASGAVKDPSVNRVEELYTYLAGKPLFQRG